jgi:hypothetical protein
MHGGKEENVGSYECTWFYKSILESFNVWCIYKIGRKIVNQVGGIIPPRELGLLNYSSLVRCPLGT